MAKEQSPAFQFYPADFLSDSNVIRMSMEDRGCYITLLSVCWKEESIPTDEEELKVICGGVKVSSRVVQCFYENDGVLRHKRLDEERAKQHDWREKCAIGGRHSAHKRKKTKKKSAEQGSTKGSSRVVQLNGKSSSSSSSSNNNTYKRSMAPDDFELSKELQEWSISQIPCLDLDLELSRFKDHEFKRPYSKWDRVWRNWIRTKMEIMKGQSIMQSRPSKSYKPDTVGLYDPDIHKTEELTEEELNQKFDQMFGT